MQNGIYRAAAYNQPAHIKNVIDQLIDIGKRTCVKNRNALVKKKFNAIKDERRKGLLNDIIKKKGWKRCGITIFNELIDVLKQASIEPREIAYMLLEVEDKSILILMINQILIQHEDEDYVPSILLNIHDDDLGRMISKLKDKPELIARILYKVDDAGRFIRLFNIVSSDISKQNMEIVLANIEINKNIANELIDKLEDEQNAILGGINNIQLTDKIKCATKNAEKQARVKEQAKRKRKQETEEKGKKKNKKANNTDKALQLIQQEQSILRKYPINFSDRYGNTLDNIPEILDIRDCVKLKKYKADMKNAMYILKGIYNLILSKKFADSDVLEVLNSIDSLHDAQTNELDREVEKRKDIIGKTETINIEIPKVNQSMNDTDISIFKDSIKSIEVFEKVYNMVIDEYKMDQYSNECLYRFISMINEAKDRKYEYKEIYGKGIILFNEIKKKICIYLTEMIGTIRMSNTVDLIDHEIDEKVNYYVLNYNEYINRLKDKSKSRSDQNKFIDEDLNEMTPDKLNMILFTVVENICKKLINENYELSDKEGDKKVKKVIEELPYFGVLINCYESNVLNIRVENDYSIKNRLMLLALFMVILICEDMIDQEIQKIENDNQPMPAIEVSKPNMMIENRG